MIPSCHVRSVGQLRPPFLGKYGDSLMTGLLQLKEPLATAPLLAIFAALRFFLLFVRVYY
jgi:hypothetical protein